jgi:hypothetical protein
VLSNGFERIKEMPEGINQSLTKEEIRESLSNFEERLKLLRRRL